MIADQLRRCEGKNCLVCRFSNSKFVVMLFGKQTSDSVIATKLANLDNYLPKVYQLEENLIQIEKRIGYAVYPDDTDSLEKLISLASLAMKESKQENHFKVIRYKKTMGETLKKNIAISVNLKHALETGMVEVFFQKAIDAFTGNVVYLEELARWKDGTLGYISPVEMFAAAKEANMVEQLDKHLVEEAIRQFAYLRNSGEYPSAKLAINIAPSSLMDPMFTTFIRERQSIQSNRGIFIDFRIVTASKPASNASKITKNLVFKSPSMILARITHRLRSLKAYPLISSRLINSSSPKSRTVRTARLSK